MPRRPQDVTSRVRLRQTMASYRIAVIPGDGIGKEVVPEGQRVLEAAGRKYGVQFEWDEHPWSCEYFSRNGRMMPEDGLSRIRDHHAIFLGAVGFPGVPDHVSLWGLLIPIRRGFHQYVNLRPVRLMPGVPSPLRDRKPGDIDFWVVRENNEGEYSAIGGRAFEGTENETVIQESVFTRKGVDRILRYAFELARSRPKKHLTSATKSNGIAITMPFWDERVKAMSALNPEREYPSRFEPVHGSAPDIAGQGIANPVGQIWSGAMMLEHLGHQQAADAVVRAIEIVVREGPKTRDMGGKASTEEMGKAIAQSV